MTTRTRIIIKVAVILMALVYLSTYISLRNSAVEFARRYDYDWISYLDISQPLSQGRFYLLVSLHFLYWPLNQVDCLLFNGIQHHVVSPLYDLS